MLPDVRTAGNRTTGRRTAGHQQLVPDIGAAVVGIGRADAAKDSTAQQKADAAAAGTAAAPDGLAATGCSPDAPAWPA